MNITLQEKLLRAAQKRAAAQAEEECAPRPPARRHHDDAPPGHHRPFPPGHPAFRVRLLFARLRLYFRPGAPAPLPEATGGAPREKPATPRLLARLLERFQTSPPRPDQPARRDNPGQNLTHGGKRSPSSVKSATPAVIEGNAFGEETASATDRPAAQKAAAGLAERVKAQFPERFTPMEKAEAILLKAQARYQELDSRVAREVESRLDPERLQTLLPARLQEWIQHLAPLYERMAALILMANMPWLKPQGRARGVRQQKPCQCTRDRQGRRIVCWACQLAGEDE